MEFEHIYQPNKRGVWLIMIGALIGFVFSANTFFQDTEAIIFSALVSGEKTFRSFSCPEILTKNETGEIRAKLSNPSSKTLMRSVRTHITQGYLTYMREFQNKYYLEPGESLELSWTIYPEDAAYGYLIMTKVFLFPQKPFPSEVGACGVMMLNIPLLKGWHIISLFFITSIPMMAIGYRRYVQANQPLIRKKKSLAINLLVVIGITVTGMCTMFFEFWYLELFLFIFTVVLLAETTFILSQT
jgi:hypothetical protein